MSRCPHAFGLPLPGDFAVLAGSADFLVAEVRLAAAAARGAALDAGFEVRVADLEAVARLPTRVPSAAFAPADLVLRAFAVPALVVLVLADAVFALDVRDAGAFVLAFFAAVLFDVVALDVVAVFGAAAFGFAVLEAGVLCADALEDVLAAPLFAAAPFVAAVFGAAFVAALAAEGFAAFFVAVVLSAVVLATAFVTPVFAAVLRAAVFVVSVVFVFAFGMIISWQESRARVSMPKHDTNRRGPPRYA